MTSRKPTESEYLTAESNGINRRNMYKRMRNGWSADRASTERLQVPDKNRVLALYKGDELLGIGTLKELAEQFNVEEKTIYFYTTNCNRRRNEKRKTGNSRVAIWLDDEDGD